MLGDTKFNFMKIVFITPHPPLRAPSPTRGEGHPQGAFHSYQAHFIA